jgi:hypothetical protein
MWVIKIGIIDIAHAASSLSRFTACPRQDLLEWLFRVFGYLKKRPNQRGFVNSQEPIYKGGKDALKMDYTKELIDQNLEVHKEIDTNALSLLVVEMNHSICRLGSCADQATRNGQTLYSISASSRAQFPPQLMG